MDAGDLNERITLQRMAPNDTFVEIDPAPTIWAQALPLGDERYQFTVRYRGDLFGFKDARPAMRVVYRSRVLLVEDIRESRHREGMEIIAHERHVTAEDLVVGETEHWKP